MYKKDVDAIVKNLIEEAGKRECKFSKKEIIERFRGKYSKDQIERISCRYFYVNSL